MGSRILRWVGVSATCSLAFGMAACTSHSASVATNDVHSKAKPSVGRNVTYRSVEALRDAAVSSGYRCEDWTIRAVANARQSGQCSATDRFAVFTSRTSMASALHLAIKMDNHVAPQAETTSYLVGANWIVSNFDRNRLEKLQASMGGQLEHAK